MVTVLNWQFKIILRKESYFIYTNGTVLQNWSHQRNIVQKLFSYFSSVSFWPKYLYNHMLEAYALHHIHVFSVFRKWTVNSMVSVPLLTGIHHPGMCRLLSLNTHKGHGHFLYVLSRHKCLECHNKHLLKLIDFSSIIKNIHGVND